MSARAEALTAATELQREVLRLRLKVRKSVEYGTLDLTPFDHGCVQGALAAAESALKDARASLATNTGR